eukprot:s1004_g28.t1
MASRLSWRFTSISRFSHSATQPSEKDHGSWDCSESFLRHVREATVREQVCSRAPDVHTGKGESGALVTAVLLERPDDPSFFMLRWLCEQTKSLDGPEQGGGQRASSIAEETSSNASCAFGV